MSLSRLKEEIRQRVDIVELISRDVELKQVGDIYIGLCPFPHGYCTGQPVYDSKPSLAVYPQNQTYYCYGCGAGDGESVNGGASDIFGWVQNLHRVNFKTAVHILADYAGIKVESFSSSTEVAAARKKVDELDQRYRVNLLANREALNYLTARGIDEELIHYGRLGLVPPGNLMSSGRISIGIAALLQDGDQLLTAGHAYRSIDGSLPKYINDRSSAYFSRRSLLYLFAQNLEHIKQKRGVCLVEGYFDALSLYRSGVKTACSCMGTNLTREQAALIARYADKVWLWFDGDYAGQRATLKALQALLPLGLDVFIVSTPGLDPDEFSLTYKDDLNQFIEHSAIYSLDWLIRYAAGEYSSCVTTCRRRLLKDLRPVLEVVPDKAAAEVYSGYLNKILQI